MPPHHFPAFGRQHHLKVPLTAFTPNEGTTRSPGRCLRHGRRPLVNKYNDPLSRRWYRRLEMPRLTAEHEQVTDAEFRAVA
ncbi:MAG TPA: hypothetical protein VFU40_00950, partial [Gemmatimonadales bacterium]|nr:hypothetical protein [Gemmatimonadales bacterium]